MTNKLRRESECLFILVMTVAYDTGSERDSESQITTPTTAARRRPLGLL